MRRLGSLRMGSVQADGDAPEAPPAPTLLLGTDNGYIYRRLGPNSYDRVYANDSRGHTENAFPIYSIVPNPADSTDMFATGDNENVRLTSDNSGAAWSDFTPSGMPTALTSYYPRDDTGAVYLSGGSTIKKSTDRGATWTTIIGSEGGVLMIDGGYLWYLTVDTNPALYRLKRANLDGSGITSFGTISFAPSIISGLRGSNRLYAYRVQGIGGTSDIVSIDISDPTTPVITQRAGVFDEGGFEAPIWIQATGNQSAVAHVANGSHGSLWRTIDAGATWTKTQANAAALRWGGANQELANTGAVVDPRNAHLLFAASIPPTVYRSDDDGATWTTETVADLTAFEWTSLAVVELPEGCTVGGHSGDIYAYFLSDSTHRDRIYRYDQTGALQEIIPLVYTHESGFESFTAQVHAMHLFAGDLYLVSRSTPITGFNGTTHVQPTLLRVAGAAGHATTILYDWSSEASARPLDCTFDSSGNIYVLVRKAAVAYTVPVGRLGLWLYKLNSSGALQWQRELNPSDGAGSGWGWLCDDDATLLYLALIDNNREVVKRYNVATDTALADLTRISSPLDPSLPSAAFFQTQDDAPGLYLGGGKVAFAVVPGSDSATPSPGSAVGYRRTENLTYASGRLSGSDYEDDGMAIDSDPDGVSLWIQSGTATNLYRFNRDSGALTKTLHLAAEDGSQQNYFPFALCGGAGGHGGPPPVVGAERRIFGFIATAY